MDEAIKWIYLKIISWKLNSNITHFICYIAAKIPHLWRHTFPLYSFNFVTKWIKWRHQLKNSNADVLTAPNQLENNILMPFFITHKLRIIENK